MAEKRSLKAALLGLILSGAISSGASFSAEMLRKQEIGHAPLKSVSLPASWVRSNETARPPTFTMKFTPANDSQSWILVFDQVIPAAEDSGKALHDLLAGSKNPGPGTPLTPLQIQAISPVMGISTIGDNQYTNDKKYPDRSA